MTDHAIEAVSKGVFALLEGDAALTSLIEGVYRHVPEGTVFPYVVIGDSESDDLSGIGYRAYRIRLRLFAYSKANGPQELLKIFQVIEDLLEGDGLNIQGWMLLAKRYEGLTLRQTRRSVFEGEAIVELLVRGE